MSNVALQLLDYTPTAPTGPMPSVPPEIFRRRMTARLLEDAITSIRKLEAALLADNAGAAAAARYHLAAEVSNTLHQHDLMENYVKLRNDAISQALAIQPMRRRGPKPK
jgi:hypothetical protein